MKTHALLLACMFTGSCLAQDMGDDQVPKNKKGNEILPKEGDIGLGFNTIPVINLFMEAVTAGPGTSGNNVVNYTSNTNNQITAKYFLEAKTAIRARLGINTLSGSITNRVQDSRALFEAGLGTADEFEKAKNLRVDDKQKFSKNNLLISVGIEKRRGYRRLQGLYGVELGFGNTGASEEITYGNAYSDQYTVHYTTSFSSMATGSVSPTGPGKTSRTIETRYRGGLRIGLRGFIGIEYFIFTKISLAAEYGWGYSIATRRAATSTQEVYNNGQNGPEVYTEELRVDSREVMRGFAVDNNSGSVFSMTNTAAGNTALSGGAGALTLLFHF
jgi:hypothetical protein